MSHGLQESQPFAWRAVLSVLCAVLVGIGLARFAYAPLVPALVTHGWFSPEEAAYLGAANFTGYLAGAATASIFAGRIGARWTLRSMMLVASVSLLACSGPFPYLWFFSWRFASGVAGGVLMVLAATTVLPLIAPKKRGFASGLMFTGVGLGIVASGTLVPLVMRLGLVETWLAIGATAALATVGAWHGWPAPVVDPIPHQTSLAISQKLRSHRSLNALLLVYFLTGVALVPHMVFLVDFVARHLKEGLQTGSGFWVLFGLGALVGPVCAGWMGDRVGFRAALRTVLAIEAFAIGLSAANAHSVLLGLSSVLVGAFVPGVVPLVLGRIQELVHYDEGRRSAWGAATIAFAAGQAGGGIVFSALFAQSGGSYSLLFGLGAATLASALLVVLGTS